MIHLVAKPGTEHIINWIGEQLDRLGVEHRRATVTDMAQVQDLAAIEILLSVMVPCRAEEMDAMPRLRAIVSPLIGYDWIDLAAATQRNIAVVNGEVDENRLGVAEATIMLMLALLYKLHETERALRDSVPGTFIRRHLLHGKTVGIAGSGGIARMVIERLGPWGCRILVADDYQPKGFGDVAFVDLDEMISRSDIIVLLTNLSPKTYHMMGAAQFEKVRPGTILINTARGGLLNEEALISALKDGRIASAALDVFEQEPLPPDHPFRSIPNMILTDHCISHNEEAKTLVPRVAAENVKALADGRLPSSCRNQEVALSWNVPRRN